MPPPPLATAVCVSVTYTVEVEGPSPPPPVAAAVWVIVFVIVEAAPLAPPGAHAAAPRLRLRRKALVGRERADRTGMVVVVTAAALRATALLSSSGVEIAEDAARISGTV